MKKTLTLLALFLLLPSFAFATPSSVDRITNHIEPLIKTDYIQGDHFVATSSTATSTLQQTSITGAISILGEYFTNFTNYVRSLFSAGTGISLTGGQITNTGVTSIVAGTNVTISGGTGAVTINSTGGSTFATTSISATYPLNWNTTTATMSTLFGTTTANNFSQLNQFNGGLTSYASTTIGNGTVTGGLTVNGTATSTALVVTGLKATSATNQPVLYTDTNGNIISDVNDIVWDETNKRLGLNQGAFTPSASIDVHCTSTSCAQFNSSAAQSTTGGAGMIGLADSGAAMLLGNRFGFYTLGGAVNASHTTSNATAMEAFATENWTPTATGAKIIFSTVPNGGVNRLNALTIDQNQNVGIGTTTPYSLLSIGGNVVIGASTAGGTLGTLTIPAITSSMLKTSATGLVSGAANGTDYTLLTAQTCGAGSFISALTAIGGSTCTAGNAGTVTAVSVATANGFTGTSSGGATPALTLTTSITGLLKGNGTALSAAAYTDFPTISANSVLANITGGALAPASLATSSLYTMTGTGGIMVNSVSPTLTGVTTMENASTTQLSSGTNTFYVDSTGHITAKDTVSGYSGVVSPLRCVPFTLATTTAWTATTSGAYIAKVVMPFAGTIRNVRPSTDVGTLWLDLYHTTTHLSLVQASTTIGTYSFTANNTVTAGEILYASAGTPATAPTRLDGTVCMTETP
jgi:hypothetical protein